MLDSTVACLGMRMWIYLGVIQPNTVFSAEHFGFKDIRIKAILLSMAQIPYYLAAAHLSDSYQHSLCHLLSSTPPYFLCSVIVTLLLCLKYIKTNEVSGPQICYYLRPDFLTGLTSFRCLIKFDFS